MSGEDDERVYEKVLLEEARMEFLKESLIFKFFNVVCFVSKSKGKNKKRKNYSRVILLKPKSKNNK